MAAEFVFSQGRPGKAGIPTLFDTDSEDDVDSLLLGEDDNDTKTEDTFESKQLTFDELISVAPTDFAQLLEVINPRLQPDVNIKELSVEDQQSFAQILIGELVSQFSIFQHQIDDPFLSASSNKELHRLIFVEVATILESLYNYSIAKALSLKSEMSICLLSESAQMSCLRAEIVILTNKRLNAPLIRRRIIEKLQKNLSSHDGPSGQSHDTSHDELQQINQINFKIPRVKLPSGYSLKINYDDVCNKEPTEDEEGRVSSSYKTSTGRPQSVEPIIDKSYSEPHMTDNELLIDLGMTVPSSISTTEAKEKFLGLVGSCSVDAIKGINLVHEGEDSSPTIKLGEYTDDMLRQDVESLAMVDRVSYSNKTISNNEQEDTADDLTPLLAVYNSLSKRYQEDSAVRGDKEGQPPSPLHEDHPPSHHTSPDMQFDYKCPPLAEEASEVTGDIEPSSLYMGSATSLGSDGYGDGSSNVRGSLDGSREISDGLGDDETDIGGGTATSRTTVLESQPEHHEPSPSQSLSQSLSPSNCSLSSHEEQEQEEDEEDIKPMDEAPIQQPQPDTIQMKLPNQKVGIASSTRVGDRSPLSSLRLQPFPVIYNELTDNDLDNDTIELLDSNLKEGRDIKEIYEELSQTFSKDYLNIKKDPLLCSCIEDELNLSSIYSSESLHHRKSRRIINSSLAYPGRSCPWNGSNRNDWLKQGETPKNTSRLHLSSRSKKYKNKNGVKESKISMDDYMKFLANNGTDFLGVIYHMYDSSGSDSEDEQHEMERKRKMKEFHDQLMAKEKRRLELIKQKNAYTPGQWNVNTVLMGGLGKDPEELREKNETVDIVNWKNVEARLENISDKLYLSEEEQVNIAIQFSNPKFTLNVNNVLELYENCCEIIEERENVLKQLEIFEEHGSDPSRYFSKGASSSARLSEAKDRSVFHQLLDDLDVQVIAKVKSLSKFGNVLTFKGRDYLEKMRMDRVELLYYVHQQRRQAFLQPALELLTTGNNNN